MPLTVRLSQMLSTYGTEWHLLSAGAFVLMIVPLLVFFSLLRIPLDSATCSASTRPPVPEHPAAIGA